MFELCVWPFQAGDERTAARRGDQPPCAGDRRRRDRGPTAVQTGIVGREKVPDRRVRRGKKEKIENLKMKMGH